jgi:hypothetical protein
MIALLAALALALTRPAHAGPADKLLASADASGINSRVAAAHQAAKRGARLPGHGARRQLVRSSAWTAVGRLGVLDDYVLDRGGRALLAEANAPEVRAHAAWALGELSRDRAWDEVHPLSDALLEAMRASMDGQTAHHVVEAFGKAYTPHAHTHDEDFAAVSALNALAASQTEQLSPIYGVVQGRVLTFELAVELLRDVTRNAREQRSEQSVAEAYTAVISMVRWLASRQDQLVADYGDRRQAIESSFDALLDAMDLRDRRLTLMLTWSLGSVASEPAFAELVGARVGVQARDDDPVVRMITAWSLHRLRSAVPVRASLREQTLLHEDDLRVLDVLSRMVTDPAEMDIVQRVYGVEPSR